MAKKYKHTIHPLYVAWCSMRRRCNNKNCKDYKNYGGRGISVCEDWNDFEIFVKDMESSFKDGLWLDRIENDKGYNKSNCRWSTPVEQQNNRSNNRRLFYKGVADTLTGWSKRLGVKRSTLAQRFYVYSWSIEKTLKEGI